jgi:hypothetical protein
MKATPYDEFIKCGLLPDVVAGTCCDRRRLPYDDKRAWFIKHVDTWVRWFHANNVKWRRMLDGGNRDQLYVWVNHWLDAYLLDPVMYQERHPLDVLNNG